jgi:D-alanyl-lipoteichoic acid acyltransferase DltB (MBOAT superfamily)
MLFNSLQFAFFLLFVFLLYWFISKGKLKLQNLLLLAASYFFYACWDWRFLFLLLFSTLLDFFTGNKIHSSDGKNKKRFWLWLSIVVNLGFLGVFKYYNFFAESFAEVLSFVGIKANVSSLNIILPVGISFYTFHGLSYVIDIYRNKIAPEKNIVDYSLFVSFFVFIYCLIAFTPLKQYIPGFAGVETSKDVVKLKKRTDDLKEEMDQRQKYLDNLLIITKGGEGISKAICN